MDIERLLNVRVFEDFGSCLEEGRLSNKKGNEPGVELQASE